MCGVNASGPQLSLLAGVLADRLHDRLTGAAEQVVAFALRPVVRRSRRLKLSFEVRHDFSREQLVRVVGGLRVGPVVAEHQERAEAARAVQQIGDVGDGIIGCADTAVATGRIVGDELLWGGLLCGLHVIGQRYEPGGAEIVCEILQSVGAVLDRLLAGVGQVHDPEHPPRRAIGLGPAGLAA